MFYRRAVAESMTDNFANISGRPACVSSEEVADSLGGAVDLILDGGKTEGGKGSTILDITVDPPRVLREGIVGPEQLRNFI